MNCFLLKTKVILHLFLQPQGQEEWTHEYRHLFYSCIKIHCVENPSQKNPKTNYLQIENTWMFLSMCFSSLSLPQTKPQQPFRNCLNLTISSIYINLLLGIKSNKHGGWGGVSMKSLSCDTSFCVTWQTSWITQSNLYVLLKCSKVL